MWSALYPISNRSHIRQLQFATHAFSQQVLQQAVQISTCQCDEPAPRTQWRMGRVLQLVKGRDGQVRGARLKVLSKAGKQSSVHRPVQRLIPFEIQEKSVVNDEEIQPEIEVPGAVSSARPRRKAAVEGQALRRVREQYT